MTRSFGSTLLVTLAVSAVACGSKSPLIVPDVVRTTDVFVADDTQCAPTAEVCNGRDDDCNGIVDDLDVAHDGITDCLNIAILGNGGWNPASDFVVWLRSQGARVDRLLTTTSPRLTPALLAPYDIVILDWLTRTYDASEADAMQRWVEAGGGLVSLTGFEYPTPTIERQNSLLGGLGIEYLAGLHEQPVTDFSPHPTTTGLTRLPFVGGVRLRTISGSPGTTVIIARLPDGSVGAAHDQGNGRAFVWGDEWVSFDSEWRSMPMVTRFWVNVLGWVAHQR